MLYTFVVSIFGSFLYNISKEVYFLELIPIKERGNWFSSKKFFNIGFYSLFLCGLYRDLTGKTIIQSIRDYYNDV